MPSPDIISLVEKPKPAILAGILGISIPMVYQGRQEGKLPADVDTNYRDCIIHYIQWYKRKAQVKSSDVMQDKLIQETRNLTVKEKLLHLEVQEKNQQNLNVEELSLICLPIITTVRTDLINLARSYPDLEKKLDSTLKNWEIMGKKLLLEVEEDSNNYVETMLDAELTIKDDS